jgi:hypothetical protein
VARAQGLAADGLPARNRFSPPDRIQPFSRWASECAQATSISLIPSSKSAEGGGQSVYVCSSSSKNGVHLHRQQSSAPIAANSWPAPRPCETRKTHSHQRARFAISPLCPIAILSAHRQMPPIRTRERPGKPANFAGRMTCSVWPFLCSQPKRRGSAGWCLAALGPSMREPELACRPCRSEANQVGSSRND